MFVFVAQKGNGEYSGEVLAVATTESNAIEEGLEKWIEDYKKKYDLVEGDTLPKRKDIMVIREYLHQD